MIENVEKYYDDKTHIYKKIYGNVIQAFRPKKEDQLLKYLINSIGFKKGQKILDAGCGIGGPAIYFSSKCKVFVDGITISSVQVAEAKEMIRKARLDKYVKVQKGDYHKLSETFKKGAYDGVVFLESLGHSHDPKKVIQEACAMIPKGGFIYIKDFFKKESSDQEFQQKVDRVISNMNKHYAYNTLRLTEVISALRTYDMEIVFIKRFDFDDDITVRYNFELDQNIDVFEGLEEFWPAEWLEIKCVKCK